MIKTHIWEMLMSVLYSGPSGKASVERCIFNVHACVLLLQSCPTLCDPVDSRLPGSSVHGILQARILEWVAMLTSRYLKVCLISAHNCLCWAWHNLGLSPFSDWGLNGWSSTLGHPWHVTFSSCSTITQNVKAA